LNAPASLTERHRRVLLKNPWFAGLSETVRDDVLARVQPKGLARGDCLFRRGDASDGVYGVLEGTLRLSGTSKEGREAVLDFYEPGAWIGEISSLDGLPRTHDAYAHVPTRVLHLSLKHLEALLERYPELSRHLLRLECRRLRLLLGEVEAFSLNTLEQRLAGRLLMLAEAYGSPTAWGQRIELHLSQELLAQLVGVSRQRVNQIFKAWEIDGLVEQRYGRVLLLDRGRLDALAQGNALA